MADDANLYRSGHPLAKQIIKACKDGELKNESLVFDYSSHPTNMAVLEVLIGNFGVLQVKLLSIISFEEEDYLIINAFDQEGVQLENEVAQKLFNLPATVKESFYLSEEEEAELTQLHKAHKQEILEENMQRNAEFFDQEYYKLDKWADDMKISLEREIKDLDAEIKLRKAESRKKLDLQSKVKEQRAIKELEKNGTKSENIS